MFLNLNSAFVIVLINLPTRRVSDKIQQFIEVILKIAKKIHMFRLIGLTIFTIVCYASQYNLKTSSRIVIHQKQHAYQCTKETSNVRNNSIKFSEFPCIYILFVCFLKDKASIAAISNFLNGNPCREHDYSACSLVVILIGKDAVVCCDFIV